MDMVRLGQLSNFACYYGLNRLEQLAAYDLVILQAEHYTPEAIASLPCQAVLGYLSLGEVADDDVHTSWVLREPASGAVARNPRWQTTFVDCRSAAWQQFVVGTRIPALLRRGIDGFFLDTVDVQDGYPETRRGVERCLKRIRECYPDLLLVVNRGFSILDTVATVADAVVFEAFTTYHGGQRYAAWAGGELDWTAQMALELQRTLGQRPVLTIDYAAPEDHDLRALAEKRAQTYGFLPFVSTYTLDWLP